MPFFLIINYLVLFDPYFGIPNGVGALIGSMLALIYSFSISAKLQNWDIILFFYILFFIIFTSILIIAADGQLFFIFTLVKVGFVGFSFWVYFSRLNKNSIKKFWTAFSIIWFLQATYIISCFFLPDIRDLAAIFRPPVSSHIFDAIAQEGNLIRLWPASGQLASGLAAVSSTAFIALFMYALKNSSTTTAIGLVSILIVGLTSGRTFYITFPLVILVGLNFDFRKTFIFMFIFILISLMLFYFLNGINESLANWIFEPFVNLYKEGNLSTNSTNSLIVNHLFFPDIYSVIVPSFEYKSSGQWAAGSDSGLIRYILFGGPIFLCTFFLMYLFLVLKLNSYFGIVLSFLLLFIVSIKQETLTNSSFVFGLIMLTWSVKLHEKKHA